MYQPGESDAPWWVFEDEGNRLRLFDMTRQVRVFSLPELFDTTPGLRLKWKARQTIWRSNLGI
jgi:hypothetical protein